MQYRITNIFHRYFDKISQSALQCFTTCAIDPSLENLPSHSSLREREILQSMWKKYYNRASLGNNDVPDLSKQWLTQPTHMMSQQLITRNARHFQKKMTRSNSAKKEDHFKQNYDTIEGRKLPHPHPGWFSCPVLAFCNIWMQIQESN